LAQAIFGSSLAMAGTQHSPGAQPLALDSAG